MKEWTVMVYMAGKNNLSDDMISAINGIRSGLKGRDGGIAFVAQYECAHPAVPSLRYDFVTSPDSLEVVSSSIYSVGESIEDFVNWATTVQPAKRYALILSGHGDGFQGRTLLLNETPHRVITLSELRLTIERIVSGPLGDKKLAILGFDSCAMNTLEGMYELRDLVDVWIGSQGNIPNSGWNYEKITSSLLEMIESKRLDPREIAKVFVEEFITYQKSYSYGGRSVDISACDLSSAEAVVEKLDALAIVLLNVLQDYEQNAIRQTVLNALLAAHLKSQSFLQDQSTDLRDYCANLLDEFHNVQQNIRELFADSGLPTVANSIIRTLSNIQSLCKEVITLTSAGRFLIKSGFSGADYQYSYGVSVFFPWSFFAFRGAHSTYSKLAFTEKGGRNWANFLDYFLETSMRKPRNPWESNGTSLRLPCQSEAQSQCAPHRAINTSTKNAPPFYRSTATIYHSESRVAPPFYKNRPGDENTAGSGYKGTGADLGYFGRIKNYPLNLTTSGGEE
jgi:hypothetical protein